MSSHGDEKDAMSPDGDQRRSRIWHGVKIQGTGMSSDLVNEGSVKRKHDLPIIPSRPSFIPFSPWHEAFWMNDDFISPWPQAFCMDEILPSRKRKGRMSMEEIFPSRKRKGRMSMEEMERIKLKVRSCLLKNASLDDAQRVAIENHFGPTWSSTPFDTQGDYNDWGEFVQEDHTPGLAVLNLMCADQANELFEMVDTGVLSEDKWLGEYLQIFDGSEPHIVAAIYQSLFLFRSESRPNWPPFKDESMKDMLVVGKLTIMLYREIHLHHFSDYFVRVVEKGHELCPSMLSGLITWQKQSSADFDFDVDFDYDVQPSLEMGLGITVDMVADWLVRSIQKTVDDVMGRAQSAHIPDQNNLPSSRQVWNRAERLKKRLDDFKLHATRKNDESALVRSMPVSILCSAAAQELDLSICQMLYNEAFVLSKLGATKCIDLDYVNKLGGLVCVIEAVGVETGAKVCSCIIKDNLTGLLLCMDVEDDKHKTKSRMFLEEAFQYVGTVQVMVTKEGTTIASLQDDGSYFQGDFKDFAFGDREVEGSCAAEALSGLPGSAFLQQSGLQCTAFHIIALAICAGAKESLELHWNGERGHIDCNGVGGYIKGTSKERGVYFPFSECSVLYTKEGKELAGDVLWGRGSFKENSIRQVGTSTICNPSKESIQPEVDSFGQPSKKENSTGPEASLSLGKDEGGVAESSNVLSDQDVTSGERTPTSNVTVPNNDPHILVSTRASIATQASREILTGLMYPPESTVEEKARLDDTAIAAVLMADKRNYNAGFSILGVGFQGGWDCRPSITDHLVKGWTRDQLRLVAKEKLTIMPLESRDRYIESKFLNGSLKEDNEEYLVIRNTSDDTCLHVFWCHPSTKELIFVTDLSVGDGDRVTSALNALKGSWLEARRDGSDIHVFLPRELQATRLPFAPKIFGSGKNVLKNMGWGPRIEGFPGSEDQWKHIIGNRRDKEGQGLYWNTTEMQAVICAATRFTTGYAVERELNHFGSEVRGSCKCSNVLDKHHIHDIKVCAVGRFSNFKGLGLPKIYWG